MNQQNNKRDLPFILHSVICLMIAAAVYFLYYKLPVTYVYLISEDSWGEYGTFVCYFVACILLLISLKEDAQLRKLGTFLLLAALIFVGMEEISWGQRLINYSPPQLIAKYNYQSEMTLHNTLAFPRDYILYFSILFWAVAFPLIVQNIKWFNKMNKKIGIPLVSTHIMPYFILSVIIFKMERLNFYNEVSEFILGFAFVMFALSTLRFSIKSGSKGIPLWFQHYSTLVGMIVICTFVFVTFGSDVESVKWRLNLFAKKQYPRHGMDKQAETIFKYLLENKHLRNDTTLIEYGIFLNKRGSPRAQEIFQQALSEQMNRAASYPEKSSPHRYAGQIYYLLNKESLGNKEFRLAINKDKARFKEAKQDWQRLNALESQGDTYAQMKDFEQALEKYNKALSYVTTGGEQLIINEKIEAILEDNI